MSPYWIGLVDARRLQLIDMPTHRCRTCGASVEVGQVDATTFGEAAKRLQVFLWGRRRSCTCGDRSYPETVVGEDFLTLGRLDEWHWESR